jgi:serine/threonine-protein kinase
VDSSDAIAVDPKIGTLVAERYRLEERLAAGGMGVVYRGQAVEDGSSIAVKFLHEAFAGLPDLVKRFRREVVAMERLSHPNIVDIIDSGIVAGVPYLVMRFHAGSPLSDVLEKGALSPPRAVGIALQILSGVAHAHACGVVHRDLKPDNVLLVDETGGERVKILDFGLAKMVTEAEGATQLTSTGFALGTPGYMSPEQAKGTATDERTDIYAVGVVLYHMVVGRRPFVADSPMGVLRMHMEDPPLPPRKAAPLARMSAELDRAILRALEKVPARRFSSAVKLAAALKATPEGKTYVASLGGGGSEPLFGSPGGVSGAPRRSRRPRPLFGALGVAAVIGASSLGLWLRLSRPERRHVERKVDSAMVAAQGALEAVAKQVDRAAAQVSLPLPGSSVQRDPPPDRRNDPLDDDEEDDPSSQGADTPGARREASTPAERAPTPGSTHRVPSVGDASRLLATDQPDAAIDVLYQVRKKAPDSPAVALLLGHAYFKKLWRTDGLREYDAALKLRPSLRYDRPLLHNVVAALDDPTSRAARAIVRRRLGMAALGELRRAAKQGKNAKVQTRAARLALDVQPARRGKRR